MKEKIKIPDHLYNKIDEETRKKIEENFKGETIDENIERLLNVNLKSKYKNVIFNWKILIDHLDWGVLD